MENQWSESDSPKPLASWRRSEAETVEVALTLPVPLARDLFAALGVALHIADASEPPEGGPDGPPDERLPDR